MREPRLTFTEWQLIDDAATDLIADVEGGASPVEADVGGIARQQEGGACAVCPRHLKPPALLTGQGIRKFEEEIEANS